MRHFKRARRASRSGGVARARTEAVGAGRGGRSRAPAEGDETLADRYALLGVVEERADDAERRDVVDATTAGGEQLGDADAHEVALAVVDEDESAGGLLAGEDALGRQHVRAAGAGNRRVRQMVQPVGDPVRAGRDDDDLRPVFPYRLGLE